MSKTKRDIRERGLKVVKESIEKQYKKELRLLQKLLQELNIPIKAKELVEEYSGLSVGSYTVKDKYRYFKLTGVKTGEKAEKTEEWLIRRPKEENERQRKLRRESKHIANVKWSEENGVLINWLTHYWTRAKALKKWLEEVDGK